MDRINIEKLEKLCAEKELNLEDLARITDYQIETLMRAKKTGYIPSKVLKSICTVLEIKPRELTRAMPISVAGIVDLG